MEKGGNEARHKNEGNHNRWDEVRGSQNEEVFLCGIFTSFG